MGLVSKNLFWPFMPQFGLKIRGGGNLGSLGHSHGSATVKTRWTAWLYSLENCCCLA